MTALGHSRRFGFVRFSNRPSGVKRFQTIHHLSVNVARGLVLLFGIGTKAVPSWDSKTRWNNLLGGLVVCLTRTNERTFLDVSKVPRTDHWTPEVAPRLLGLRLSEVQRQLARCRRGVEFFPIVDDC